MASLSVVRRSVGWLLGGMGSAASSSNASRLCPETPASAGRAPPRESPTLADRPDLPTHRTVGVPRRTDVLERLRSEENKVLRDTEGFS